MVERQQPKSRGRDAGQSPSLRDELVGQFRLLTPQAFTEDLVDFAKLREFFCDQVDDRPERFSFTWAGRHDAMVMIPGRYECQT